MNIPTRTLLATLTTIVLVAPIEQLAAQGPLADVRSLYAAANYEDALSALSKIDATTVNRGEAEQYRAFCLIALGRTADAERAIEAVVAADPLFVPQPADVSPRILAMFTDVRRRILPEIARRAYLNGRSAFLAKDFAAATTQFDQVMRMIDQAGPENAPAMDDLRILVAGFVDLTRAATESPARAVATPEPPAASAAARTPIAVGGQGYTPPVAVYQEVPAWNPPNPILAGRAYSGAVKVVIGPDGHVQDAVVTRSVHPMYDAMLLQAARRWTYRPATRLGEATTVEKVVEIRLMPR